MEPDRVELCTQIETVVKMEMDDNDADDINEAQDEAAEAGETRGNKRRYGVANET